MYHLIPSFLSRLSVTSSTPTSLNRNTYTDPMTTALSLTPIIIVRGHLCQKPDGEELRVLSDLLLLRLEGVDVPMGKHQSVVEERGLGTGQPDGEGTG